MKSKAVPVLLWLLIGAGCNSPSGPPTSPSRLPDQMKSYIGKLFFHDLSAGGQYDIFMADLIAVPGSGSRSTGTDVGIKMEDLAGRLSRRGVMKISRAEIDGRVLEDPVLYATASIEAIPAWPRFALLNLENVTATPAADEYDPAVSSRVVLAYVLDPDGRVQDGDNTEIVIMDLTSRVPRQLTPINGQYAGENWDPEWKDEQTITWVHRDLIIEANIDNPGSAVEVLPDWNWPQFDPLYSPDGSKLLFNSWVRSKKNSYWKDLRTGAYRSVLPQTVFNACTDDNPTWVFSNTLVAGHAFMPKRGRIYTRDLEGDTFLFLTDGSRDFRYVTPVALQNEVQFIFSDYTNPDQLRLWTCRSRGDSLRPLRYMGDEAMFALLGFSAPRSGDELNSVARLYVSKFVR